MTGKHRKPDKEESDTQPLALVVPIPNLGRFKVPDSKRVEKDTRIVDKGWNNVPPDER